MTAEYRKVPFLKYDYIRQKANEFLEHFNCNSPVCPIEYIVDVELGIDIVETPGLYRNHSAWGVLSHDFSQINIDQYCAENYKEKFRFTLAHEIGHMELHVDSYKQLSFESITQWPDPIFEVFTPVEYSAIETQADMFAGLVLVPGIFLLDGFNKYGKQVFEELQKTDLQSIGTEEIFNAALHEISQRMAPEFIVSPKTIETRLFYDGLQKKLREMLAR